MLWQYGGYTNRTGHTVIPNARVTGGNERSDEQLETLTALRRVLATCVEELCHASADPNDASASEGSDDEDGEPKGRETACRRSRAATEVDPADGDVERLQALHEGLSAAAHHEQWRLGVRQARLERLLDGGLGLERSSTSQRQGMQPERAPFMLPLGAPWAIAPLRRISLSGGWRGATLYQYWQRKLHTTPMWNRTYLVPSCTVMLVRAYFTRTGQNACIFSS